MAGILFYGHDNHCGLFNVADREEGYNRRTGIGGNLLFGPQTSPSSGFFSLTCWSLSGGATFALFKRSSKSFCLDDQVAPVESTIPYPELSHDIEFIYL